MSQAGPRAQNADALHAIVAPLARALTTEQLGECLRAEDVPHAPITRLIDLHRHPQVVANGLIAEMEHPQAGSMRAPLPVGEFERTGLEVPRLAPGLGEHTDEVLTELGLPEAEIASLRLQEIVG